MDLAKRKADLETARERCAAQLNAILGQLQLVDELLTEKHAAAEPLVEAPKAKNGAGVPIECHDADDDA